MREDGRECLAVVVVPAEVVVAGEVIAPEVAPVGPTAASAASATSAAPTPRGRVEEQLDVAVVHGVPVLAHCLVGYFIIRLSPICKQCQCQAKLKII